MNTMTAKDLRDIANKVLNRTSYDKIISQALEVASDGYKQMSVEFDDCDIHSRLNEVEEIINQLKLKGFKVNLFNEHVDRNGHLTKKYYINWE